MQQAARKNATSSEALEALRMLSNTQSYFVDELSQLCIQKQLANNFTQVKWLRDNGVHGGGLRYEAPQNSLFNQASVNVSQIQYEDNPEKKFISATALSTIIHPHNPLAPSVHIHISWTELRSGKCYWRLMADLNPAIACENDTKLFTDALKEFSKEYFHQAKQAGDEYFHIPALNKHRGVSHFYLEGFNPKNEQGKQFAEQFVIGVIDTYISILANKLFGDNNRTMNPVTQTQIKSQLDYHTLYFYQVLTLDKGTTAGLLIHNQNDIGTLGSLPRYINRDLLLSWVERTPEPRNKLVQALALLADEGNGEKKGKWEITTKVKTNIAKVIRSHYKSNPL